MVSKISGNPSDRKNQIEEIITELFESYYDQAFGLAYKYLPYVIKDRLETASDIVQNSFEKIWMVSEVKIYCLDAKGTLPYYFLTMVKNEAIDQGKKFVRYCESRELLKNNIESSSYQDEEDTVWFEKLMKGKLDSLLKILKAKKPEFEEIIRLYYYDNLTHKEIAGYLGISESLSKQRLRRAIKLLKEIYDSEHPEDDPSMGSSDSPNNPDIDKPVGGLNGKSPTDPSTKNQHPKFNKADESMEENQILKYIRGELKGKKREEIKNKIEETPFGKEIIEGYKMLLNDFDGKENIHVILHERKAKARHKLNSRPHLDIKKTEIENDSKRQISEVGYDFQRVKKEIYKAIGENRLGEAITELKDYLAQSTNKTFENNVQLRRRISTCVARYSYIQDKSIYTKRASEINYSLVEEIISIIQSIEVSVKKPKPKAEKSLIEKAYLENFSLMISIAYNYGYNEEESSDIVQSIFLRVLDKNHFQNIDSSKFRRYLINATRSECLKIQKWANFAEGYTQEELYKILRNILSFDPSHKKSKIDLALLRDHMISILNPEQYNVLELYMKGYSYAEIALRLKKSKVNVRQIKFKAFSIIRNDLHFKNYLNL